MDGWRLNEREMHSVLNVVCHVSFAWILGSELRYLIGTYYLPYVIGIVDVKVLIQSRSYNVRIYIYDLLCKRTS